LLITLQLTFCSVIGIFYSMLQTEIDEVARDRIFAEDIHESEYHWIIELATNKSSLQGVYLQEKMPCQMHSAFIRVDWDPPFSVEDASENAGIELTVGLRASKSLKKGLDAADMRSIDRSKHFLFIYFFHSLACRDSKSEIRG
jgi:hypothetical protein